MTGRAVGGAPGRTERFPAPGGPGGGGGRQGADSPLRKGAKLSLAPFVGFCAPEGPVHTAVAVPEAVARCRMAVRMGVFDSGDVRALPAVRLLASAPLFCGAGGSCEGTPVQRWGCALEASLRNHNPVTVSWPFLVHVLCV